MDIRPTLDPIDEELNQFDRDIRQLKIEYDQFFGGGRSAMVMWCATPGAAFCHAPGSCDGGMAGVGAGAVASVTFAGNLSVCR